MEIKKIVLFTSLMILLFSCNENIDSYKKIGNDLYLSNDTILLLNRVSNFEDTNNSLSYFYREGVYMGNSILLTNIIDTTSFQSKNNYYFDKNFIYFFNEGPLYFPTINIIPSISGELRTFHGDYVETDNRIFFRSTEIKSIKDISSFGVTCFSKNGIFFAFDDEAFYFGDSIISDVEFLYQLRN